MAALVALGERDAASECSDHAVAVGAIMTFCGAIIGGLIGGSIEKGPRETAARSRYSDALAGHPAAEIAETFFNSVTRRILGTVGVNPEVASGLPVTSPENLSA